MNDKTFLFIDSNIYISSGFNFESGSFAVLKKYCVGNVIQLLIDDIVLNEVAAHIKTDISKAILEVNNKLKNNSLSGLKKASQIALLDTNILVDFVLEQWSNFLNGCKVNTLLLTDIHISDILDDYFGRKPPFENKKDKKNEFPDAVIIKNLKHFMQSQNINTKLFVISGDKIWEDCFEDDLRIQYFDNISAALEIIGRTENGSTFCEMEKLILSAVDELKSFIQKEVIEKQELFLDFDFEDVEEVYFRNIDLHCQRIEFFNDNYVSCSVEFIASLVIDYDKFIISHDNGYYYAHDAYRDLHQVFIELSVSFKKDTVWNIHTITLKKPPIVNEKTFLKTLPIFCSECETRLFSENETDSDICKECGVT